MSSDLTVPLALLGGVVVAGVLVHGWWQARRARPKAPSDDVLSVSPHDPPTRPPGGRDGDRDADTEPWGELPPVAPGADAVGGVREPMLVDPAAIGSDRVGDTRPGAAAAPVRRPTPLREPPQLDALIDAIATVTVTQPVSGEAAIAHLPPSRRAGNKPFRIEGLNAETGEYEGLRAGQRYSEFQAGVQMANRKGAINEIEYSEFVQKVQDWCDALGAMPDFPDMLEVVARGRELDAFAGDHDAQLAVHLRARGAGWSVPYIQQHAARHGFVTGLVPGRLVMPSREAGAPPLLVLGFDPQAALTDAPAQTAVRDVTLSFDVPQSPQGTTGDEPFLAWQAAAQALSLGMDADVVDDRGQPIEGPGFASIGAELGRLYEALAARDLAAGSSAARRLFS